MNENINQFMEDIFDITWFAKSRKVQSARNNRNVNVNLYKLEAKNQELLNMWAEFSDADKEEIYATMYDLVAKKDYNSQYGTILKNVKNKDIYNYFSKRILTNKEDICCFNNVFLNKIIMELNKRKEDFTTVSLTYKLSEILKILKAIKNEKNHLILSGRISEFLTHYQTMNDAERYAFKKFCERDELTDLVNRILSKEKIASL